MAKALPILGIGAHAVRAWRADGPAGAWPYGEVPAVADGAADATAEGAEAAPAADPVLSLADALKAAAKACGGREFALALPLADFLAKVVRTPVAERERRDEAAGELLDKVSPFPDEWLVTSSETVAETDTEIVSLTVAVPEASRAKYDEALEAAKIRVVRTDALAFGWVRTLWPQIGATGRKLVLLLLDGGCDILMIDGGALLAARGITPPQTSEGLAREAMLTAFSAAGGAGPDEVVLVTEGAADEATVAALASLGPVRAVTAGDPDGGIAGAALRLDEETTLDATPEAWNAALVESRFRRKLAGYLAAAGAVWLAAMGVLFGVPMYFDFKTDAVKEECRKHKREYEEVRKMKDRVDLVKRYSDHNRGALEILKAVSDRLPTGVTLTQFSYQTLQKLNLAGESEARQPVLEFKDALVETKVFADVALKGPNQGRNGQWKFSIEATFEEEEK